MEIKSNAFEHNWSIPPKYTCDGEDINPPFSITALPENTKSVVLIMDDPDATAGITFDHWVAWNIAPENLEVEIGEGTGPKNAVFGSTGFGKNAYGGPCPPASPAGGPRGNASHRYMFKVYALDATLDLPEGSSKQDVEKAMKGHVVDEAALTGLYGR